MYSRDGSSDLAGVPAAVGQLRDPYDEAIDAQVARDGQLDAGELPPPPPTTSG